MYKIIKTLAYICIAAAAITFTSCTKDLELTQKQREFTEMLQPGLVTNGTYTMEYSSENCQLSSTSDGKYRVMTDDQSRYMEANVTGNMKELGTSVNVHLKWYLNDNLNQKELTMIVSKMENGTYWLWNEEESTGVIIRKLI